MFSFMDAFSGYNQMLLAKEDPERTSFENPGEPTAMLSCHSDFKMLEHLSHDGHLSMIWYTTAWRFMYTTSLWNSRQGKLTMKPFVESSKEPENTRQDKTKSTTFFSTYSKQEFSARCGETVKRRRGTVPCQREESIKWERTHPREEERTSKKRDRL